MFKTSLVKKIERLEKKRDKLRTRLKEIGLEILALQLENNPPQPKAKPEPESQPESEPPAESFWETHEQAFKTKKVGMVEPEPPAESSWEMHERAFKKMTVVKEYLDKLAQLDINIVRARNQMKVASSFMQSGNYEKTMKYLQKAQVLADIEADKVGMVEPKYSLNGAPAQPLPVSKAGPPEAAPARSVELKCPNCEEHIEIGWIRCPVCCSQL